MLVNDEKGVWQPTQSLTWLGLNWNGDTGTISITSKRIEKVDKALRNMVSHPKTSARKLASAVGMIISMGPVMGSLTRTMTRHCQMSIACSPSWDSLFDLDMIGIAFWNWNSGKATLTLLIAAPLPLNERPPKHSFLMLVS